jgi:site-specific recombinase XerD
MFLTKRNGIYYLWFKNGNKWVRVSCRTSRKDEAFKFQKDFDVSRLGRKTVDITLENFTAEFLKHTANTLSLKTVMQYRLSLHKFHAFVGNKLLKQISIKDADTYKAYLVKQGLKAGSVNEYLTALQTAFEAAVKWEYLKDNPVKKVEHIKFQRTPPAFMSVEQITAFLEALPKFWKDLYLFALLSGSRASEIVNQRWQDIDFLKRTIQIGSKHFTTKNRKVRIIPMHEALVPVLEELKRRAVSDFVFSHSNGKPYSPIHVGYVFRRYRRICGLPEELHLHSTRHTFASLLVSSGVPIYSVSKLLGHSSLAMTQIYSHLEPQQLSDEVQRLQILA